MDNKDRQITYLNATTAAATLLAGTEWTIDEFNETRDKIYSDGVEYIAGIIVEGAFPGAVNVTGTTEASAAPTPVASVTPIGTPAANLAAAVAPSAGPAPIPGVGAVDSGKEAIWRELFADSSKFYDNRADKAAGKGSSRSPDFKRKSDKAALWIVAKDTPQWVLDQLQPNG